MRTFRPFITTALAIALAGTVILPKALPSSTAQAAKPAATHSAVHTDLRKDINCSPVHVVALPERLWNDLATRRVPSV